MSRLSARIAWRFLWKRKSHGAVSAIAGVSVAGVAVASAAIICVLSVFNGFREVLVGQADRVLSDVEISPAKGGMLESGDSLLAIVRGIKEVEIATPVVADQALAIFDMREMPVELCGVESADFRRILRMDSLVIAGVNMPADPMAYDPPAGMISVGVGIKLHAFIPGERIFLFAPRRYGRINPANPAASFFTDSITICGIFESRRQELDASTIYVPIEIARGLFDYGDDQMTSIMVSGRSGIDCERLGEIISGKIGDEKYIVKDKIRRQTLSFRMVEIEKWVTGLLLLFILMIASFNIISTLTMFVLEKRKSIDSLRAIGMDSRSIGGIFGWESFYVSIIGGVIGIIGGILLVMSQQKWGWLTMQGDSSQMIIQKYPVRLELTDLWAVVVPIIVIGIVTAWIAASFARSRIAERHR